MIHEFILAGYQYFFFLVQKVNELQNGDENILNAKSVSGGSNLGSCSFPSELLHSRDWLVHELSTQQAVL